MWKPLEEWTLGHPGAGKWASDSDDPGVSIDGNQITLTSEGKSSTLTLASVDVDEEPLFTFRSSMRWTQVGNGIEWTTQNGSVTIRIEISPFFFRLLAFIHSNPLAGTAITGDTLWLTLNKTGDAFDWTGISGTRTSSYSGKTREIPVTWFEDATRLRKGVAVSYAEQPWAGVTIDPTTVNAKSTSCGTVRLTDGAYYKNLGSASYLWGYNYHYYDPGTSKSPGDEYFDYEHGVSRYDLSSYGSYTISNAAIKYWPIATYGGTVALEQIVDYSSSDAASTIYSKSNESTISSDAPQGTGAYRTIQNSTLNTRLEAKKGGWVAFRFRCTDYCGQNESRGMEIDTYTNHPTYLEFDATIPQPSPSVAAAVVDIPTATKTAGATGPIIPTTPTGLTVTSINTSQVNLSWDSVSGATSYDIERDGTVIKRDNATTSYSDTTTDVAKTQHTYKVRANRG